MGFKKRGYNKETSEEKTRDYSLFVIACEGTEREPEYFRPFDGINRVKVDIVENKLGHRDSAPKKVLERVQKYIDEIGLSSEDNDSLWFVIDVDKWPRGQIEELADYCIQYDNWNIVISNPCFEIWLLYHKLKDLSALDCTTPTKTKQALHNIEKGGYFYLNFIPLLREAVVNAKAKDTNLQHYLAKPMETKVYLLGEALLKRIGIPRFEKFVNEYLPTLQQSKKNKI